MNQGSAKSAFYSPMNWWGVRSKIQGVRERSGGLDLDISLADFFSQKVRKV